MSEILVTIIVTVVASSGFWAFLQAVLQNRARKKSIDRKALLALLHDKLYFLLSESVRRGSISADEYENIMYLYEPYAEMGGNGTCERLLKEVNKLPITKSVE